MLAVLVVAIFVTLLLAFTPLKRLIGPPGPAEYAKQIVELQRRIERVSDETLALKEYNLRLRLALGDKSATKDSALLKSIPIYTSVMSEEMGMKQAGSSGSNKPRNTAQNIGTEYDVIGLPVSALQARGGLSKFDAPFTFPVDGYITRAYDAGMKHYGLDIAGKTGTTINAAGDGYVVFAGWTYNDGYMMIIAHGSSFLTVYKHNQSLLKTISAYVRRAEPIALLGNSGTTSMGPHLHFEIWKDGIPRDPSEFLLR
jgi:murein DD-endopeptidase MepM/ murein hydrolase activator NlpD